MNSLHVIVPFLVAAGAVYLMMLSGIAKNSLESKRAPRICPSCGRRTDDCRCRRQ